MSQASTARFALKDEDQPLHLPARVHTWNGFRAWAHSLDYPRTGLVTFVKREIFIDMSPEAIETHNKVKSAIERCLGNLVDGEDLGEYFGDRTFVTNKDAQFATEPDGTFVSWATSAAGRVRMVPRKGEDDEYIELQGTPDWVVEIVSKSSVKKDTRTLRNAYHEAGIREYWLVDARGEEIDLRILVRRRARYIEMQPEEGWHRSPVFGKSFRLTRRRNRMGRWSYRLEHK